MIDPHQFSMTATAIKPITEMTRLYDKLNTGVPLTREEKDRVADGLYGMGGSHSMVYKRAGWAFNFGYYLKRFIILSHNHWQVYYAPDKTSLRKCSYIRIEEIHELPNKNLVR